MKRDQRGFSLIELLTTVGIVGTLSTIGIKSYNSQTNKARKAEAKKSLSFVYTAEQNFKENWGTYHENLVLVGAIPSGAYYYDIGFSKDSNIHDGVTAPIHGKLDSYPLKDSLNFKECLSFKQICDGGCINEALQQLADSEKPYFKVEGNCKVVGCGSNCLKTVDLNSIVANLVTKAQANESEFTAVAVGEFNSTDVWSINEKKQITNDNDGTQ